MGKPPKSSATTRTPITLPAAQVMSFLRDVHSLLTWTEQDFVASMNVGNDQTKAALGILQLAGYVELLEKVSGGPRRRKRHYDEGLP
jgi:hypothetical protein